MDEINPEELSQLIASVQQSPKYAQIAPSLVERIAREELQKRSNFAESVKVVRSRLHQLTGAYLPTKVDYAQGSALFKDSAQDKHELCKRMLRLHASTAERLPFLENFYATCLASISPVHSILDLACGLNPLALPWMPLAEDWTYLACDVLQPMIDFLNAFFASYKIKFPITDEYVDAVFREIDLNHDNKIQPIELETYATHFVNKLVPIY